MIVLRLQRTGRKNQATYRIVAAEKSRAVKGKFLEILGHYLPAQKETVFEVNADRVSHWVKQGALPSDTLARLLKKNGIPGMDAYIVRYTKRRPKKEPPEAPVLPPEAPKVTAEEAKPEEPKEQAEPAPAEPATPADGDKE